MRYVGNKRRICKEILPIILTNRKPNQYFIDIFCGSCSICQEVDDPRIANDNNYYLIELLKALQEGWIPPSIVTEKEYIIIRDNKHIFVPELVGFAGFCCSFGGKWFGGFCRGNDNKGNPRNFAAEQVRDLLKQVPKLKGINFRCCDYRQLEIPPNSLIYCDPPYKNTTKYSTSKNFNYEEFYQWCREQYSLGHQIFVSEYEMPDDFICVWQKKVYSSLDLNTGGKTNIEKLWTLK